MSDSEDYMMAYAPMSVVKNLSEPLILKPYELAAKIKEIDHLFGREEHDSGYQAFVKIRKIWPELKRAALAGK